MDKKQKALFDKIKKEHYTILVPDMLPITFSIIMEAMRKEGYTVKLVSPKGRGAKDEGLRSVHNDACYPALVVTGAFIDELKHGNYDLSHTAVIMSQTGGGCRASNYIALIRKAFAKEFPTVPVLSLNFSSLEKEYSIPTNLPFLGRLLFAIIYGDFITNIYRQLLPYEQEKGKTDEVLQRIIEKINAEMGSSSYYAINKNYKMILAEFAALPLPKKRKARVAIVGEIFVKYSAYANNHLEDFLVKEGVEVTSPSLTEFLFYWLENVIKDADLYGMDKNKRPLYKMALGILKKMYKKMNRVMQEAGYIPFEPLDDILKAAEEIIHLGVKMGEGWLIPAEMLCYAKNGTKNIVCAQPFGCLPNHIVGKGMVRPLKALCPDINIVPIDFDASSTQVNQENRLKLMLSNLQ